MRHTRQQNGSASCRAILLQGLGFGDEGKGASVDYLKRRYPEIHTVVRYNGGAQAAHNVVAPDGTHHVFSQFGSATLAGADTFLSRFMIVNPVSFLPEAKALEEKCVKPRVVVDREALVTIPYQVAANRLWEMIRGGKRHGSCGMGIGETVADARALGDKALRVGDLLDGRLLVRKLELIRAWKMCEIETLLQKIQYPTPGEVQRLHVPVEYILEDMKKFRERVEIVEGRAYLKKLLQSGTVLFEGAQGVLLDEDYGFHPHTTWSKTTFENALQLLVEVDCRESIRTIGVIRAMGSRHGAGPFPTEDESEKIRFLMGEHNAQHDFQGAFRVGHYDAVLAQYVKRVLACQGGLDEIFVTCLDRLSTRPKRAYSYEDMNGIAFSVPFYARCGPEADWLVCQERMGMQLAAAIPQYEILEHIPSLIERIESDFDAPVTVTSWGPKATDRREVGR